MTMGEEKNRAGHFSPEIIDEIGYYVYRLIDPRNGQTFYVGKGKGNRVFDHVKDELKDASKYGLNKTESDDVTDKIRTIREIRKAGLEVIHVIQRWGMETEKEAFLVESTLMDCFPALTNIQSGHDAEHGVCNAMELENRLRKPTYDEPNNFKYLIIKITESVLEERGGCVYETVRSAWKLDIKRAKSCKYVFASLRGIIEGVFEPEKWEEHPEEPGRYRFEGKKAPKEVWDRFVHKRLPAEYMKKGAMAAVLYSKNEVK